MGRKERSKEALKKKQLRENPDMSDSSGYDDDLEAQEELNREIEENLEVLNQGLESDQEEEQNFNFEEESEDLKSD